jgi:hypothetical protein
MNKCIEEGHAGKVVKDGYRLENGQMHFTVELWGCTRCDATSQTAWEDAGEYKSKVIDHSDCDNNPCFGCKAKGLQLATGDASGHIIASGTTQKKWDKELDFYRDARSQGIQPESTNRKAVEKAIEASEVLNKPYSGETMVKAKDINKETVAVMKEIGQI